MAVLKDGGLLRKYPVSTSKFGLGDSFNSYKTPLGQLRICDKIGDDLPIGAVLKSRNATGEILPANAPGRDPIVTRILWLEGLESGNANARSRGIYIHGTVEESKVGQPVSYGCIRMRSKDVIEIFESVPVGTLVEIVEEKLPSFRKYAPPKNDVQLFASRDNAVTTFGPRGLVTVRANKPAAAPATAAAPPPPTRAVPASAPEPTRFASARLVPKLPESLPKPADTVAKVAAKPAPIAEGPTVLLTSSRTMARLQAPTTSKTTVAAEGPHVFLMAGSMLTADLAAKPAPPTPAAVAPPTAAPAPEPTPVATTTGPHLLALNVHSTLLIGLGDEAPSYPLDAFSQHLLNPPPPEFRLAFRVRGLASDL